jgi:hypothetical protein
MVDGRWGVASAFAGQVLSKSSAFGSVPHAHTRAPAHDRSAEILSLVKITI